MGDASGRVLMEKAEDIIVSVGLRLHDSPPPSRSISATLRLDGRRDHQDRQTVVMTLGEACPSANIRIAVERRIERGHRLG